MKKRTLLFASFLFLLFLGMAGCKKKAKKEIVIPQKLWTTYETEMVISYAADEEGNLYTFEQVRLPDGVFDPGAKGWFRRYDAEGRRVFSKEVPYSTVMAAHTMAYREGKVYFATQEVSDTGVVLALYACDTATGEMERVLGITRQNQMLRIAVLGERLYLLGSEADISSRAESGKVLEYSLADGTLMELGMEEVLDLAPTRDGKLLVYQKQGTEYVFLLYDTVAGAVRELARTSEKKAGRIAEGVVVDSVVFTCPAELSVGYAFFSSLDNIAEIYPNANPDNPCFAVAGDRVVLPNVFLDDTVVGIDLTGVTPQQKVIRYISDKNTGEATYGCGFTMERRTLESEKLVLKLLAQDTDFDMTYVDSFFNSLTGVRDSGCFYPLNAVPGVQEYLDCCFPYVREAVTDKDGNIWMLPVEVNIEVMACDTAKCRENGYAFTNDMDYGEFLAALRQVPEQERGMVQMAGFERRFLTNYFYDHKSVDTQEFRQMMNTLREIKPLVGNVNWVGEYIVRKTGWTLSSNEKMVPGLYGMDGRAYSMPKLHKGDKNVGTCRGFIINPKSDNLEQTLSYVATFIAYQRNARDLPLFFAVPKNRTDSFLGSVYGIYENGAITMGIGMDLYWGFLDVIAGERDLEEYIRETEKKLKIYFGE